MHVPVPAELLERADELERLQADLGAVAAGRAGRLLYLGGEAGVGKTALLRRFCGEVASPARVLWGGCDPLLTPAPLGPLAEVADTVGGELAASVAGDAQPHEVAAGLLLELARQGPTVLVIEDVHWADEATLDVLRLLGRRIEGVTAFVVASYRDDEVDRAHPLRVVLGEAATCPAVERLSLTSLSLTAVATLAASHAIAPELLHRATGGNPFFVTEVLAGSGEEIPATVRDAVLARSAQLSSDARQLLDAVATIPGEAEVWLLEAIAGDRLGHLDEALASGMLAAGPAGVGFRHELARLAVEESLTPHARIVLHRKALAALVDAPGKKLEHARLAHHAEASGDAEAVLRFAPPAAERAAGLGAHREAAAQYARALRFADGAPGALRAELLERRAEECFLIDATAEAIDCLQDALAFHRDRGDHQAEARALTALSDVLWCPGRVEDAIAAARRAVSLLEGDGPTRALAMACCTLAQLLTDSEDAAETQVWGTRALELGEALEDDEVIVHARTTLAVVRGRSAGLAQLEETRDLAARAGLTEAGGRVAAHLASMALRRHEFAAADRYLTAGLEHCRVHGLDLFGLYVSVYRASWLLFQGRWDEAVEVAEGVLRDTEVSRLPRVLGLTVVGLVRARRGRPGAQELLDDALAIALPTGELQRIAPAAAARAEMAWLSGDRAGVDLATAEPIALARRRGATRIVAELASWRWRVQLDDAAGTVDVEPYAALMQGRAEGAAAYWDARHCPYEAALARAGSDDEEVLRASLDELHALDAGAAAAAVARRLREKGAHGLPRGPRAATRANPANLTARELEVLGLVAEGLQNADIAQRLYLSHRTVDHHVSAILRKLDVRSRVQATTEALRLGLTKDR